MKSDQKEQDAQSIKVKITRILTPLGCTTGDTCCTGWHAHPLAELVQQHSYHQYTEHRCRWDNVQSHQFPVRTQMDPAPSVPHDNGLSTACSPGVL